MQSAPPSRKSAAKPTRSIATSAATKRLRRPRRKRRSARSPPAPTPRARHEVVESQLVRRVGLAAILAAKPVAQKDVEPGESRMARSRHILLQRDDARQLHLQRGAAHADIVVIDDVDAIEEHRLD